MQTRMTRSGIERVRVLYPNREITRSGQEGSVDLFKLITLQKRIAFDYLGANCLRKKINGGQPFMQPGRAFGGVGA
jgi:hypothetical protein